MQQDAGARAYVRSLKTCFCIVSDFMSPPAMSSSQSVTVSIG